MTLARWRSVNLLEAALLTAALATAPAQADTTIVDEQFEGYADQAAFMAQWVPTAGNGTAANGSAGDNEAGYLVGCPTCAPTTDPANYPGIQGQAADHIGAVSSTVPMVNQWGGIINQANGQNPVFDPIAPSATQNIVLKYDLFDGASGNERMSVGLRYINVVGTTVTTENILELGLYNSNSADATVVGSTNPAQNAVAGSPGFYSGRGYGARVINFGPAQAPLTHQPDWQYFRTEGETWGGQAVGDLGFAVELNRPTDTEPLVSIADIGPGWHQYEATITTSTLTITIDLFRDGKRNTSTTPDEFGDRPGTQGVDAKMVYNIGPTANGFNSLRIGGPSGLSSAGAGFIAFDNINLSLVDIGGSENNADFDTSGTVDGKDFLTWQAGFGLTGQTGKTNGNANTDTVVDGADFAAWVASFGGPPAVGAAAAGVPEPTSVALTVMGLAGLGAARRRAA